MFYAKLALINLKKNGKTYIPYILTCILTVMMFYIMNGIARNSGLDQMPGAGNLKLILIWASGITGIFSAVFLFYTNSFLVKQRKKEFGLYQVLGMDKSNLTKMMVWEIVFIVCISLAAGLGLGVLLGRLLFLILLKMLHFSVSLEFALEPQAVCWTVILFLCVFAATLLFNLLQVKTSNPIELLSGGRQGEREPKTKWILTVVGAAALGAGYFIAQTTDSPLAAIGKFFLAVILVIIGTYCLFTAGSIAFLKGLKKNRSFYYKPRHFTAVSGMIYRMKQNAVGLANICIMSTVVLVLISVTVSLYAGMEDILTTHFPVDLNIVLYDASNENVDRIGRIVEEEAQKAGVQAQGRISYRSGEFSAVFDKKEQAILLGESDIGNSYGTEDYRGVTMLPLEDYNKMEGKSEKLEDDEILVYSPEQEIDTDTLHIGGQDFQVKKILKEMKPEKNNYSYVIKNIYIVMPDVEKIADMKARYGMEGADTIIFSDSFNLKGDEEAKVSTMKIIKQRITEEVGNTLVEYREEAKESFYSLYGGFLFLGIFVGALFLMATVLIIYYKQVSEGYDDRGRYQIMQKVGMSKREVKSSIKSQVLLVFFIPLAAAILHVSMAFKTLTKLLATMNLVNTRLFLLCTLGTIVIFGVFYGIVFLLTSRQYYKIVE